MSNDIEICSCHVSFSNVGTQKFHTFNEIGLCKYFFYNDELCIKTTCISFMTLKSCNEYKNVQPNMKVTPIKKIDINYEL